MRNVIASSIAVFLLATPAAVAQAPAGGAAAKGRIGACALLPKDLVMKVSSAANKMVFDLPPQEETVGQSGSACEYGDIRLQIDPFAWSTLEAAAKKDKMEVVPGVGDGAYFGSQNKQYAGLMGRVGARTFTIQMGVPFQSSAEKIKPNVIALAQAIVPKLK